jgi:signal peptidase I
MTLVLAAPPPLPPPRRRLPWRPVVLLLLAAALARMFLFESLVVASGSMEPLLHGDPARGDRLLVMHHGWRLAAPERFDLVVFEREDATTRADERVVVKRVAATGGESLRIAGGELFVRDAGGGDERAVVKSYHEFRDLLVPLWREPFDGGTLGRLSPLAGGGVELRGRELHLLAGDGAVDCGIRLAGEAAEFDDGFLGAAGVRHAGTESVGDVCFRFDVAVGSAATALQLEFEVAERRCELVATQVAGVWRIDLDLLDRAGGTTPLSAGGTAAAVRAGAMQRFECWHVDGRVGAAVDGRVALEQALERRRDVLVPGSTISAPRLRVSNGDARLAGFEVLRDLHWTTPTDASFACGGEAYEVPIGALFVLGDASSASTDSRHYGAVPVATLRGRPLAIWQPSGRLRRL